MCRIILLAPLELKPHLADRARMPEFFWVDSREMATPVVEISGILF